MFWCGIILLLAASARATPIRICVPDALASDCHQMAQDLPEAFSCVVAPDTIRCLEKVSQKEADLTNVDPAGFLLAGKYFNLQSLTTELIDGEPYDHRGIALVKKGSDIQSPADLRNKSSCHTGLGRTVGWQIPMGKLLAAGIMTHACDESELSVAHKFFGGSCVPGPWSSDPEVERALKSKYPDLCSRCKNPETCAKDDAYYGYPGVMACMAEGAADVAFSKIVVLKEYLKNHPDFEEKAELLCFEGGRKSVTDPEPCVWTNEPTPTFVGRRDDPEEDERLVGILLETQSRYSVTKFQVPPAWFHTTFLSIEESNALKPTEPERTHYLDYLGDFIYGIRRPRLGCETDKLNSVSFCATSEEELQKCRELSMAAEAKGMWPDVACVQATSKAACMQLLKEDNAQLLILDGGDVYKAGKYFDLHPIASELYNGSDASYYAVAVLRSASDATKLSDLRGLASCHTGIGRTAGWVMPVGTLISEKLLPEPTEDNCNHAAAVADFFSRGSCVPGANDTKYNKDRTRSDDLCKHCVGDEQGLHKCSRDSKERFSGYAGAFRCLAEGKGDVAFVKHLTVPDYTDGHSDLPWTRDLLSSDFMLLCDGGGTAPVNDYLNCNLGKVPSHQVVTLKDISEQRRLDLVRLLADTSKHFGDDSTLYRLFSRSKSPDLLFKDSATGLKIVPAGQTYEEVLGQRFVEASIVADPQKC